MHIQLTLKQYDNTTGINQYDKTYNVHITYVNLQNTYN